MNIIELLLALSYSLHKANVLGGLNVARVHLSGLIRFQTLLHMIPCFAYFCMLGGLKWTRTTDLVLIRHAL